MATFSLAEGRFLIEGLGARLLAFVAAHRPEAYLVGGFVRDLLLGRDCHDFDLIVPHGGVDLARTVARAFGGAWFVLDAERDVARAVLAQPGGAALAVDVARFRADTVLADLAYRDFTVNALAVSISPTGAGGFYDPFDGQTDLARGRVRAVSEGAFVDDPLRILRGVRLAAELGFTVETATFNLMRRDAPLLSQVAAERVRDELVRIIGAPGAWQHVRLLERLELLPGLLPEAAATVGVEQSPPHYQSVFDHSRSVMAHLEGIYALLWPDGRHRMPQALVGDDTVIAGEAHWAALAEVVAPFAADLRQHLDQPLSAERTRRSLLPWAAFSHDWGKPARRTVDDDGRFRFFGHDHWGALLVEARMQALRFSAQEVAYLARLTDQHMRPGQLAHDFPPSRRAVYHFFRDTEGAGPDCLLLGLADRLATRGAEGAEQVSWQQRLAVTGQLLHAYFRQRGSQVDPPPLLNGVQLMAGLSLPPGPFIGQLLAGLREAQAAGEVTTVADAWAWARGQAGQHAGGV